jgi:hypothetical protein
LFRLWGFFHAGPRRQDLPWWRGNVVWRQGPENVSYRWCSLPKRARYSVSPAPAAVLARCMRSWRLSSCIAEKPRRNTCIGYAGLCEVDKMRNLLSEHILLTEEIDQAYLQANGKWSGCDWPRVFGKTGLNLNGLKALQALLLARSTAGSEREDWRAAVTWLTRIEQDAREAEEQAMRAVVQAGSGKLKEALVHAQRACVIEARHHCRLVWQPLREAIEAALAASTGAK